MPKKEPGFAGISLRRTFLTKEKSAGRVSLGKRGVKGSLSRGNVAKFPTTLLEDKGLESCWLDLLGGEEEAGQAVGRCVEELVDCVEGANVGEMMRQHRETGQPWNPMDLPMLTINGSGQKQPLVDI